jgi:hypothetical protein
LSHALRVGVADQIGYFRAYNTDGSAKTDLTSSTTGLALSVFRVGASAVSISSLSAKAADNTAHADGAIRAVSGNLYTVDLPDAACADQVPSISVKGSYTGGVIEGPEHPLIGYNPASVAVGALTPLIAGRQIAVAATTGAVELDPASLRSALGMSAADLDSQLDAILAAASAGAGTGARTVTITVNDGTNVLQNAIVRFTEGANTFRALTNASGVAVFNLDDATYTVAVTKSGYTYAGTTMVVNGTETATYSMTVVSVTPPTNPDLSAVVVLCLGTDFEPEAGVTIDIRIKTLPSGSTNTAYPGIKQTATSNGSGIATLEAPKGSVCEWKRGKEDSWTEITIGSDDQTNVTSIIGSRY